MRSDTKPSAGWRRVGEDLEVARILLGQGKYSHACFCGQQAAETAASLVPR